MISPKDYPDANGHPANLTLIISGNPLQCDSRLCWIKEGEEEGWITWPIIQDRQLTDKPGCENFLGFFTVDEAFYGWDCFAGSLNCSDDNPKYHTKRTDMYGKINLLFTQSNITNKSVFQSKANLLLANFIMQWSWPWDDLDLVNYLDGSDK